MKTHVVTQPTPPFALGASRVMVHQVPAWKDNLVWLLVDAETQEAAAVDGPEADSVLDYCAAHGFTLTTIFNTHTHPDHIGINRALERSGLLQGMRVVAAKKVASDVPGITEAVEDGDQVNFAGVNGEAWLTEGHIDGHISFVFDGALFCGDTMFGAGCGYLFDGPPERMHQSLTRLAELPGETRVCCAHEYTQDNLRFAWSLEPNNPALKARIRRTWAMRQSGQSSVPSTIAEERATNPFLRADSPELLERLGVLAPGAKCTSPAEIFAAARALKDSKAYVTMDMTNFPVEL